MEKIKLAICGMGSRGMHVYGKELLKIDTAEVTAIAEPHEDRRNAAQAAFGLKNAACFNTLEELLKAPKTADAIIIATQDRFHRDHAISAMQAGYDILLEKPVAITLADCEEITNVAGELGRKAVVCHVLRYAPFYQEAKKAIVQGKIGELVNITAMENVGYWHQAHSFVRGNWSNTNDSTFMLLAKCCHDLDLLVWLMDKPCEWVSSFGSLSLFRPEKAPKGSTSRCLDGCAVKESCPFDCEHFYLYSEFGLSCNKDWPVNTVTEDLTESGVREALRTGHYGRCVYAAGNDVVDHQVVNMQFEGGTTASLTMSGLTANIGREIHIMGTKGEIYGNLEENKITIAPFGGSPEVLDFTINATAFSGHGGGDEPLITNFIQYIAGEPYDALSMTSIEVSLQSHQIAFAAEQSRLTGKTVAI